MTKMDRCAYTQVAFDASPSGCGKRNRNSRESKIYVRSHMRKGSG